MQNKTLSYFITKKKKCQKYPKRNWYAVHLQKIHENLLRSVFCSWSAFGAFTLCYRNEPNLSHLDIFIVRLNHEFVTWATACLMDKLCCYSFEVLQITWFYSSHSLFSTFVFNVTYELGVFVLFLKSIQNMCCCS